MKMSMRNAGGLSAEARNKRKMALGGMTGAVFNYTAPMYEGPYEAVPKAYEAQVLETKDRTMRDNVTVDKVPFYEVSNAAGGVTCYVAEEAVKWE